MPIRISGPKHVMSIMRDALESECMSYIILANRRMQYKNGGSKIIYIGQTMDGIRRVAESTASRTEIFEQYDVREIKTYIISCEPRQRKEDMWGDAQNLERAMLKVFEDLYGERETPKLNRQGAGPHAQDALNCFSETRIRQILRRLG